MNKISAIIYLSILLLSCESTKLIPQEKRIGMDTNNPSVINGLYDNNSTDTIRWQQTTFWGHLKPFYNDTNLNKTATDKIPNSFIGIRIIDQSQIEFKLYESQVLKATKLFDYSVKDGIILIKYKHNRRVEGVPYVIYRRHGETLNLALDKNKNLILAYDGDNSGGVFILNFGAHLVGTHTFPKMSLKN